MKENTNDFKMFLKATQFCGTDQTQDRVLYRQFASGQLWSFLSAVLFQECEYLQYIEVRKS